MLSIARRILPLALVIVWSWAGAGHLSAAGSCVAPGGAFGCSASINDAIAAAAPGTTIRIYEGHYAENVVVDRPLTLIGAGEREHVVIVPALSNPQCDGGSLCGGAASNIILVQANDVTIQNLTLDGDNPALTSGIVRGGADLDARNGIITDHSLGVTFNDLTVVNVTVKNIYLRGVYASSGGTFEFRHDTVINVQGDGGSIGMFNYYGGSGRFVGNKVVSANDAISSNGSAGVQFLDNIVQKSGSGIHTDNAFAADLIQGNRVSDGPDGAWGIWVFMPYVGITVKDNDVSGMDVGLAAFGGGPISAGAPGPTMFVDNDLRGRRTAGSMGLFVTTDTLGWGQADVAATLTGNTVEGFETGVVLQSAPNQAISVSASCNAILHSTKQGIVAGGLGADANYPGDTTVGGGYETLAFAKNTINGKKVGLENRGSSSVIATDNYWGCPAGPGGKGCDTTIGNVVSTPWLTRPARCVAGDERHERREGRDDR